MILDGDPYSTRFYCRRLSCEKYSLYAQNYIIYILFRYYSTLRNGIRIFFVGGYP
jgi:hypothetical protein